MESFWIQFLFIIYGRASLAMEGKSVVTTEITYMDMEDIQIRYIVYGDHQNTYIQFIYIVFGDHQNTYIQIHF